MFRKVFLMSPKSASILTAIGLCVLFFISASLVMPIAEVADKALSLTLLSLGVVFALSVLALVVLLIVQAVLFVSICVVVGVPEGWRIASAFYRDFAHWARGRLAAQFPRQSAQLPLF